ncbi:hypothetical protein [Blastopirellula marina]|uniref:Glycosyltransferase RgtA/B/C/D-like domain-containing protein n=1 Tax=Blastopirellula marina TaxID=124 RepID=A0A2S8F9P7_9BACT|nr:hypothetical protein [Blastopirellula marina]PQO28871.1 hypothetical protein C5Y98_24215 [Blastopirellula marina]PTL42144.1 hypothetical protein C5Y97_24230 [Blastopirellula marina]
MNPKLSIPAWLTNNWGHIPGVLLLLVAAALTIHISFLSAFAADEIAFFIWGDSMARNGFSQSTWGFLFRPNGAGYGSAYWTVYVNMIDLFGTYGIWGMRVLSCGAFIGITFAIAAVGNLAQRYLGYLLAALWLSMPIAWWCGKVSGPETFSLAFSVFGVLLLYIASRNERQPWFPKPIVAESIAWLLIGGAVSLKVTFLPCAMFGFLIAFGMPQAWEDKTKTAVVKKMLFAVGMMAAGFIICTPVAVLDPHGFLFNLTRLPRDNAWRWDIAQMALSNQLWGWDGIFAGGLVQWSLCPLAMGLLGFSLLIKSPRVFAILLATFLGCWAMICSSGALLGWYWFGWIPMIVLAILWSINEKTSNRGLIAAIAVTIVINLCYLASEIVERYDMKSQQAVALTQLAEVQQAVIELTKDRHYDMVLDYWEVSHVGGLTFPASEQTEVVQMTPPHFPALIGEKASADDPRTNHGRGVEAEALSRIFRLSEKGTEGKSVLLVISKRLASKHAIRDLPSFSHDQILPKSPPGTACTQLLDLPHTVVYELTTTQELSPNAGESNVQQATLEVPLEQR